MPYCIDILNTTDNVTWFKVAELHETECTVKVSRTLNTDWTISISYTPPSDDSVESKVQYFAPSGRTDKKSIRLRVRNMSDAAEYETFTVIGTVKSRNGAPNYTITGEHVSVTAMSRKLITSAYDFQNVTADYALGVLLSVYACGFAKGVVAPTTKISVYIAWESLLSAVQKILTACAGEYDIDEVNGLLNVSYELGSMKYIHIRPEKNLKSISCQAYQNDIVNVLYGVGGGTPVPTMASARHVVASILGQVVSVNHAKLVPEDDSWNTNFKAKFVTGALAGQSFVISDSIHIPGFMDSLVLTGTLTGAAAGDKIVITDLAGSEVPFLRAGTSISANGQSEAQYTNSKYSNAVNIVKTPFLDGPYTSGLCVDWTKEGLPTLSENTTVAYIQYGSKSQKVVCSGSGQGISQTVAVSATKKYRIKVNVFLEAANPAATLAIYANTNLLIDMQVSDTVTGKWILAEAYGSAGSSSVAIKILQGGSVATTFYVDAVQISECESEDITQNFTPNCEQLDLWFEAFDKLATIKDARVEYKCNFVDLHKQSPLDYPYEKINLGDTVIISDDELGISGASARIKQMNYDPFNPDQTEHIVSNL
jgi:hypothetical protein